MLAGTSIEITGNEIFGHFPTLSAWFESPQDAAVDRLPWVTGHWIREEMSTSKNNGVKFDMAKFSSQLKKADICSFGDFSVPGSNILLPWGVSLNEHHAQKIRTLFKSATMQEYSYPSVVPEALFEPMADLMALNDSILKVGTDNDSAKHHVRGALTPTGEQVIYSHWKTQIRDKQDLPIRMFQRANYYRPVGSAVRSGGGVFSALEARDVYEFHSCYADSEMAKAELSNVLGQLQEFSAKSMTPTLWGVRPPWGNKQGIYEWSIAGDCPLENGKTVQVSAVYKQGTHLSRRYDITFSDSGQKKHVDIVDGFISRRHLYAHLLMLRNDESSLCLHPNMSSLDAIVIGDRLDAESKDALIRKLTDYSGRVEFIWSDEKKGVKRILESWRLKGVPLRILCRHNRAGDLVFTSKRGDSNLESSFSGIDLFDRQLADALHDVAGALQERLKRRFSELVRPAENVKHVRELLAAKKVVVCAMAPTKSNCDLVSTWGCGEVLSFCQADDAKPCVISLKPVVTRAYIARRI